MGMVAKKISNIGKLKIPSKLKRSQGFKSEAPNARAVCVLKSWLRAVKIAFGPSDVAGCDLFIVDSLGRKVEVVVTMASNDPVPMVARVTTILAPELTHPNNDVSMGAFHAFTEALGYGSPVPVDRGPAPESQRLDGEENVELVAMRHCEFRRAPNPPEEELKSYSKTIKNICNGIHFANGYFFNTEGHSPEDLYSYGMVIACNYIHKYKRHNESDTENMKLFANHLKQRMMKLVTLLKRKARNASVLDRVDLDLWDYIHHIEDGTGIERVKNQEEDVDPDEAWLERNVKLKKNAEKTRRKHASKLLEDSLSSLSQEDFVLALLHVIDSPATCPDAKEEAQKRLDTFLKESGY